MQGALQGGNATALVKFKDLRVIELNGLLRRKKAIVHGNKDQKIAKLIEVYGADSVNAEELNEDDEELSLQDKVSSLQATVDNLAVTVNNLVAITQRQNDITATMAQQRVAEQSTPSICETAPIAPEVQDVDEHHRHATHGGTAAGPRSTWPTRHKISDIIGILPVFDPFKGQLTSEQFIRKVEQLRQIYSWSETETLFSVQHALKGVAKEWADCQPVFCSWAQFVSLLLADFPTEVSIAEIHREMGRRRRKPNEKLQEFYYAMLNLGRKGNLDERSISSYIVAGLNDINLTRTLSAMNVSTCAELLRSLENLSQLNSTAKSPADVKPEPTWSAKETSERKQVRCFNCNENGHIAAKCPLPMRKPKCSKCNKFGHEAKMCKGEKATVTKIGETAQARPPVVKRMTISGNSLKAFIDTGSDFSLISDQAVPATARREPKAKRLEGFGGAIVETTEVAHVEVEVDSCKFPASMLVVPRHLMSNDLLVGRDILCREDSQVVIESGVMRVQPTDKPRFHINEELHNCDSAKVADLLARYEDCFSEDLSCLGRCKTTEMEITITSDKPVVGKRYQVPFAQRPVLSSIIDNLLRHNIIRPSSSPHAAPVVLVKKANGEERMCVDYRALNAVTVKKQFPMPVVEEQLMKLAGNEFFTTLDLTSGYYQIPLKEESKQFTAFFTPEGLYEHNVMPFGLVNAPMVFQEMIIRLIRELNHRERIISYVDEVVMATRTVDEGVLVLEEFLAAVRQAGLTLRPSKCFFMGTEVKFLGHIVRSSGIQPGIEKTQCVAKFPRPQSVTETRQFLGLTGFFRKFIEGYGLISKPLTKLLKKDEQFVWAEEQEKAFTELKQVLMSKPVLVMFDQTKEHEVHTDASSVGISGVLLQKEAEGLKPVHYYSRQCSASENQYASHELEVLAIVESLDRFRLFLLGRPFVVVTDCNAIATTKATTLLRPRIARWWLRLQEFDFTCIHRPGVRMAHVDSMSRAPVTPPDAAYTVAESVMRVNQSSSKSQDWVFAMQMQDKKLQQIVEVLSGRREAPDKELKQLRSDYIITEGRLFRQVANQVKLVVPGAVRWRIVRACHDEAGHSAVEKTIERVQKNFWFPRVRRYVKSYIASCEECCLNKVKGGKPESQLHLYDVTPLPFRNICIDHLGPFPKSKSGNTYILVIVCQFSKYVLLKALRNTKSGPVVKTLEEMVAIFGQPRRVTSDRGTAFTSAEFQKFVVKHGVQHVKTAVRTPRANGQAERVNKTLLSALKCSTTTVKDWDTVLCNIQWAMNSQRNSVTKFTPNELVFNYNPRDVVQNRMIQALHDEVRQDESAEVKWAEAADNIMKERRKWKVRYDKKHQRPKTYHVGDLVVTNYIPSATGTSHKLDPVYKGPYVITKVLDFDRYIAEDLPDTTVTQRRYSGVVSADHLKPWCCLSPELDDDDESNDDSPETDEESGEAELSSSG